MPHSFLSTLTLPAGSAVDVAVSVNLRTPLALLKGMDLRDEATH